MTRGIVVTGIVALALVTGCGSSRTQERVVVTPPPRALREAIVVERTHVPKGHAYGWWKQHGYREITVYYDGSSYYSRRLEPTGFRAVIVYQRDGKYYLPADDDAQENRHGHHHDRDDD